MSDDAKVSIAWAACTAVVLSSFFFAIGWANSGPSVIAPRFSCEVLP